MSHHLPEVVRWSEYVDGMVISPTGYFVTYSDHVAALRACEARVRWERVGLASYQERPILGPAGRPYVEPQHNDGPGCDGCTAKGYAAALDAARDAVAAVEMGGEHFWSVGFRDGITIALAAIDALKEKS